MFGHTQLVILVDWICGGRIAFGSKVLTTQVMLELSAQGVVGMVMVMLLELMLVPMVVPGRLT